jgi:membrane-associated phospholipid phosphatase
MSDSYWCRLTAALRVLLGMHFLSDALVGCGIGSALGYFACHLVR